MSEVRKHWWYTIVGSIIFASLTYGGLLPIAQASECAYYLQNFNAYLAACQTSDGCASRSQMKAMVDQQCGASEPPSSSAANVRPSQRKNQAALTTKRSPIKDDYTGQECSYFTRPMVERDDIAVRMNMYPNNARSCYQGKMYQCASRRWKSIGDCSQFENWQKLKAERQERNIYENSTNPPEHGE